MNATQARKHNVNQMNAKMNAEYAVVRSQRTSTNLAWKSTYLGIMSYRKYSNLLREADDANGVMSMADRQNGGIVGYQAVALHHVEGGVDGEELRKWIFKRTGKNYDARTGKVLDSAVYNPNKPVQLDGMTIEELKDVDAALNYYVLKGPEEALASRLLRVSVRINAYLCQENQSK